MDTTNNPVEGIGSATEQPVADTFKALLDSENAATNFEGTEKTEALEASFTSEEDIEDDAEQTLEDSEGVESDETEDAAAEAEAETEEFPSDETVVGRDENGNPITLETLRKGQMLHADYTRKTQEIAELRKKWVVAEVEKQEYRSQVDSTLGGFLEVAAVVMNLKEPDWQAEWEKDPYEAQLKKFEWDKKQVEYGQILNSAHETRTKLAAETAQLAKEQTLQRKIEAREQLATEMPEYFGEKTAKATYDGIGSYLANQGIPNEMITGIDSSAIIKIVHKAMMYDRVQSQKAQAVKKVEAKPALTMPGTTASKTNANDFDAKLRDFKRSGSSNMQGIFKALLDNE